MSRLDYEAAKQKIALSKKKSFFYGPKSDSLIEEAQRKLAVRFPPLYIAFLQEFGAGGIGSLEIYGLTGKDFISAGVPDVVWYTLRARNEWGFPHHLIPIYDLGDGTIYSLDLGSNQSENEASIVAISPPSTKDYQIAEVVAKDFGEFLLESLMIEEQI